MTDIVERLREFDARDINALNEAADEIERLREVLKVRHAKAREDKAEIERLRARIRELETIFLPDRLTGET